MNQITNNRIYDIYRETMDQPVPYGHHRDIRNFARAIIKADRALRKETACGCELGAGPCDKCGLINGCSVGCGDD